MDSVLLQQKIYGGYAQAASRIGPLCTLYRPASAANPLASANIVASLPASFNAEDMAYRKPSGYGEALRYCLIDGTQTQAGDYLVGGGNTWFIAAQQLALPILAVACNRVLNLSRPQQLSGAGTAGYGGETAAGETVLMSGWPASVLQGGKGERSEAALPGDVRNPWWQILLPQWAGVTLRSGDIVSDDISRRYVISSAELSGLGWRLTAVQAET